MAKSVDSTSDEAEICAAYLKALADPTRLRIVQALRQGSLTVTDIALLLELEIATVSHHLRILFRSGVAVSEREGRFIYYAISPHLLKGSGRSTALDFGCCKLDVFA